MSLFELFKVKMDKDNLKIFYNTKIAHKASAGIDKINRTTFERENIFNENIDIIHRKSLKGTYKFSPYMEKLILKGRDKNPRVISIPTIRDKITLGILKDILSFKYSSELSNKLTHSIVEDIKNAVSNKNYQYFIKLDIKGFYDHINRTILLDKIKKKIKRKELLQLLQDAIENPTKANLAKQKAVSTKLGIPQGISISNILANIYLNSLDKKFERFKNISYFRYVDDILILCNRNNVERIYRLIDMELIDKLQLGLNEKEDKGDIKSGFDYLGYRFTLINKTKMKYGFTVQDKNRMKLENSLIRIFSEYKGNENSEVFIWKINLRITGFIIDQNKYGWLFFYSQIDDISVLYHLDSLIEKLCVKHNIHEELQKNIKKFVKAYHEIIKTRGNSSYIPKARDFTAAEQRRILQNIFGYKQQLIDQMNDEEILKLFRTKLFLSVKDLEKDVQTFS
ncbi:reverse transcriptase domain-containing protein [Paenibacillus albiflavus]|nr:reverse transcriptase domain-containing protein [Paenibacillus albiflavus]